MSLQMPFLEHDLMGLNMARTRFSETQILFLFRHLVLQTASLHAKGLVHRDIKASNVLLGREGIPSLIDFGHCVSMKGADGLLGSGTLVYLSPERLLANRTQMPSTHHSKGDVWGLGCILAELLLGRPLFFRGNSQKALITVWEDFFGNHTLANALRKTLTSASNLPQEWEFKKFPLRSQILGKCPWVSESTLDLLEKLLDPNPLTRPSCQQILGLLGDQGEEPRVLVEIQEKLKRLKTNCHEHNMRQRLKALRKLKMAKAQKFIQAKPKELQQKQGGEEIKDLKLAKRADAPASPDASSLKRIKACLYRELRTPIN